MKKIIALLLTLIAILLFAFKIDAEYKKEFEGYIFYQVGIVSNDASIQKERELENGTSVKSYYKKGNYLNIYNGNKKYKYIIYSQLKNTIFFFDKNKKIIDSVDCKVINDRKVVFSQILDSEENILNRKCKHYIEKLDDGEIHSFYYDSTIYVNPEHYKNFPLYYSPMKNMKSQYLAYTYTTLNNYTIIYRATHVVETELDDKIFEIN